VDIQYHQCQLDFAGHGSEEVSRAHPRSLRGAGPKGRSVEPILRGNGHQPHGPRKLPSTGRKWGR
jgi:hypothetical protein